MSISEQLSIVIQSYVLEIYNMQRKGKVHQKKVSSHLIQKKDTSTQLDIYLED